MALPLHITQPDPAAVLSKALGKAAEYWSLSNKQLAEIIGLSEATVSRLKHGRYAIEQHSTPWQLTVLFLRAFRGLDAYMGGNVENEKRWLNADNTALGGTPVDLMRNVEGLVNVVQYIDTMRGH